MSLGLLPFLACSPGSLPPAGQILLYVNTDAPLPPPPGEAPRSRVTQLLSSTAFGSRSTHSGETASRATIAFKDFPVDRDIVSAAGQASIGVVPTVGVSGYRARVRLYTSAWTMSGEPAAATTLDTIVALPADADGRDQAADGRPAYVRRGGNRRGEHSRDPRHGRAATGPRGDVGGRDARWLHEAREA